MVFTSRGIAVGLTAWCSAFLVAYVGRINPIHFGARGVTLLTVSGLVGFIVSVSLGRKLCRYNFERGTAIMVFSLSFYAGIYSPITAICANARLYEWSATHSARPKSYILTQYLAPAVEHTGSSHYAGAILLLGSAWLIARRIAQPTREYQPGLGWPEPPDMAFATVAWVIGGATTLLFWPTISRTHWLGYTCAAFLLSLVFRSIRLQWRALRNSPPPALAPNIPRIVGTITIATLWLGFPVFAITGVWLHASKEWIFGLWTVGCILPWLFFRASMRRKSETLRLEHDNLSAFAMRCGFWSGIAITFFIGGQVLTGVAAKVFDRASSVGGTGLATPFALTVMALKPFYNLFAIPSIMAGLGGFLVAAILPSSTRASQRIMTCAQGGATLGVVNFVLLVLFALNLALVSVPLIPLGEPLAQGVTVYFAPSGWCRLAFLDFILLAGCTAAGAVFWATKASIICGVIWLKDRYISKTIVTASAPPPIPAQNPPPAPSM